MAYGVGEEATVHEAFPALTSRASTRVDATDMIAGSSHRKQARERTKETEKACPTRKAFIIMTHKGVQFARFY